MTTDPRIARGMAALLARRRKRLADGERPLGWKVAFGSAAALERLGTTGPLVGFLTDAGLLAPGATVSIAGWTKPVLEPEIAVRVGPDGTIAALGPAIELVDLDFEPDDPERILAANIFHRHVVLGRDTRRGSSTAGLHARVWRNDDHVVQTDEPEALTGSLGSLVAHVASTLAAFGEELHAGEFVIAGSVVPPLAVEAGDEVRFVLEPIGAVEVAFS